MSFDISFEVCASSILGWETKLIKKTKMAEENSFRELVLRDLQLPGEILTVFEGIRSFINIFTIENNK